MGDFRKKIKLNENRIIDYSITAGTFVPTYGIGEGFIGNNTVQKTYDLSRWDDYGFGAWCKDRNATKVSFEFDIDHPLFMHLFRLLNYDNELIIDDDDTRGENRNYMIIYMKDKKIYIDFINNLTEEEKSHKFSTDNVHVFIKNICYDVRSKIDSYDKDTKIRLYYFFRDVFEEVTNNYHQVSLEECILKNSEDGVNEEMKRFFKRKIELHRIKR